MAVHLALATLFSWLLIFVSQCLLCPCDAVSLTRAHSLDRNRFFRSRSLLFHSILHYSIQDPKHELKQCHASSHTLDVGYALNGVFMAVNSYECVRLFVLPFFFLVPFLQSNLAPVWILDADDTKWSDKRENTESHLFTNSKLSHGCIEWMGMSSGHGPCAR